MIKKAEKNNRQVTIDSTDGIFKKDFDDSIAEIVVYGNRVIIRLAIESSTNNRNIFCLNEKAEILWQIQDRDTYRPGLLKSNSPFTGVYVDKENRLRVTNWDSHGYEVDIKTGKLLEAHWTK